ncbi:MAG: hypothetical protein IJN51_04345 [Alistipes sp.]|nr:hypothetical protein [Alistipes sp.]
MFKNLMLVAVAAMTFTACTETNEEVNAVAKKTIINGVATIDNDDTRSGFVSSETTENEDGTTTTTYKSAWDGGETIKLYINYGAAETTATIDAEGKFTAEFEGDFAESCTISACSPAESWSSESSFTIPAEQTPRTDSVDPAAHILKAQAITVTNGSAKFNMQHEVAYGKMAVNTPAEFVIDHVDIELNGAWYGYAKSLSYTINADNVEDNTFWFATDVIEVSEMTVTAYDADDKAYTKTVTMNEDKTLKFQYYKVSTFSVSNLTEQKEVYDYTTAYVSRTWSSTDKLITFTAEGKENMNVNFAGRSFDGNAIAAGTYTYGDGVYSWGINFGDYSNATVSIAAMDSAVVSIVDGCYVMEFNNLKDNYGNIVAERITFKGTIDGLDIPDSRQALATPNATATVVGKTITISWDPVDNAEGYRVELYSPYDEYLETIITGTEYVYEAQQWNTNYSFTIMSYASNENETYKPSEVAYVDIKTEKDPNAVLTADYTATDIVWNDTEQRFEFIGADLQYFYIKMNANDRPGNNSFAIGDYTGAGTRYPVEKQFSVMQKQNSGYSVGWTDTSTVSTMSIDVKNGEYVIYIDYTALYDQGHYTIMYKGRPTGFDIPGEDNNNPDEGGNDEEDIDLTGFTKMNLSGFEAGAANFVAVITFEDPVYGDEYKFSLADINGINVSNKTLAVGEYTFVESFNSCELEASDYYYIGMKQNATGKVNVYNNNGVYTIKCEVKIGNSTLKHYYQGTL